MSDVIGRGVIEVSADSSKLKAGVEDAKRSIRSLGADMESSIGTASKGVSRSIDNYVKSLQAAAVTQGRSTRESELYKLALRGASEAQLGAANSALRMAENYEKGAVIGAQLRTGFIALAAAAGAAAIGTIAGTQALINQVGTYQDVAEKIGDTAVAVSSLKTASDVSGTSIDTIATASVKLTAALSKTDDESKAAGQAIRGLGLDFQKFKSQSPVEQLQSAARAMEGFADGSEKTAYAVALFGKSGAELLGFLKEYAATGLDAAYVTAEQAKAADDYSDAQSRLKSQIQQFLQVAAVNTIPLLNEVADLFRTIGKEQDGTSTATDLVKGAISGLVTLFQALVVVGSDVGFVFKTLGNDLGAIAAGYTALAHLDIQGFNAISKAVKEDDAKARATLDAFQARVLAIGQSTNKFVDPRILGRVPSIADQTAAARPKLDASGLNRDTAPKGRADNSAAQEAKAQLALDLDEIRKAQDALTNTIGNGEKLLAAQRAANLISESEYYAGKRANIQTIDAIEESAVQREIDRLQREVLTGKDKIDNDRRIADAQAKLAKVRENAAASLQVLGVQETSSLETIARAYTDARIAAQNYLDVTERGRREQLEGLGKGSRARDFTGAISQITEKYEQQRQDLQRDNRNGKFASRQDDYDRELALLNEFQGKSIASYTGYYEDLTRRQADFSAGAAEALHNYVDESANVFKQAEDAVTNAFKGMEDALVSFATTGKADFKGLANSIIADIVRIQIRAALAQTAGDGGFFSGLLKAAGSFFGSGSVTPSYGADSGWTNVLGGRAIGGPVSAGSMYQVNENGPELLNVGGKQYLMMGSQGGSVAPSGGGGGSGSTSSGGGDSSGASSRPVTVNVTNNGNAVQARSSQRETSEGTVIDIVLDAVAHDMQSGGRVHDATQRRFGLNPGGSTPRY